MSTMKTLFVILMVSMPIFAFAQNQAENRLLFDNPLMADLEGGEIDTWIFSGEAGQIVSVSAERFPADPNSQLDPLIEIYDPAGNLIFTDDNSGSGVDAMLIQITLPTPGDYQLLIKNVTTWAGGTYLLTIAENHFPTGCASPLGTMITGEMPSQVNRYNVRYRVFLPPCHEVMQRRYPYILLMHGSNSDDRHWDSLGMDEAIVRGVALNRMPPVALVLPFGGELANTNTFQEGASWEYVVIDELMPYVEANYPLQTTRDGRAIGGISRGGFWAFLIAFRHPELFATLGGHSPFFDLYHAPATYNPLDLALAPPPNPPLRIWIDRGRDDYAQLNIDLIHDRLIQNGIVHTFMLYETGEHENAYWGAHVDDYLQFYTANWIYDEYPEYTP